ncbi:GGDEF domain-containing protein [Sulfurospirillum oryzae]|uniref:GGDEF domain-containing protein n=1 Tax=Sulfurospirillum oryzae TaxID=2976535 RepID=UPI0021E91ECD|nr:GGDEF domain-containing protein [Sulfurospirillum oryzae]
MYKSGTELKKALQEVTRQTFGELHAKFNFVIPRVYTAIFNRKMAEMNLKITARDIDEEFNKLLEEMDQKAHANEDNFSILLEYSDKALSAMENEDKTGLKSIQAQTAAFLDNMKELEQKAYFDDITGFLNRNGLRKKVCTSSGQLQINGSLFFIDLDHFKHINDTYGHQYGDAALKAFANLLTKELTFVCDEKKFLCRAGGDEFVVVIEEESVNFVRSTFQHLQEKAFMISLKDQQEPLGFSFGEAMFTVGNEFEKIVTIADIQMYQNKNERRNKSL